MFMQWQAGLKWRSGTVAAAMLGIAVLTTLAGAQPRQRAGKANPAPDYGIAQVRTINEHIRTQWKDWSITPSAPANDGEWCRRVYLDILGRVPSVAELTAFLKDDAEDKKAQLVETLLNDEKYTEEYARNWTTLWTNILIGRSGGTEDNTPISRPGMQKYLRDSFARNKPYDRMVRELVSATGVTTPGASEFNGAANFLVGKLEENATLATADTAKIFLGLQVQCTQCHNHPFNEWKQQKFWELNAFFRQTRALRERVPGSNDIASAQLANEDFGGESGDPDRAEIFFELRNGEMKVAYPVFVDGTEVAPSGFVQEVNRRDELAKLIVNSEYMPKAMVNRVWAHFLGYGFTKPVDDLGPHNAPSHPELLDYLGVQFRENSFNIKELMKWVALSEPYSLSSKISAGNKADDPTLGEQPKFSHFYLRQMSAEQLYESLLTATHAQETQASYEEQEKTKREWLSQFVIAFGNDEGLEATTFNGTIPQALMMMNGDLVKKATSGEQGSFLWKIANSNLSNVQKIEYLFQAGLARKPNNNELTIANKLLVARKGDPVAALQDMWWAVLNSNEFILNH
jgi:hypothetical protein